VSTINDRPFLSTGKLIENYKLLVNYMKKCKEVNLDCSALIPSSDLLVEVKTKINSGIISRLSDLVDLVEEKYSNLVICELAQKVFTEIHGYTVSCELARKILLIQLAGWITEMLESLGYVKIKFSWR
jgi:hypothetical protein